MRVFRSADGRWRIEQTDRIRVFERQGRSWVLRTVCLTVSEVTAWLIEQGDPVNEWVED